MSSSPATDGVSLPTASGTGFSPASTHTHASEGEIPGVELGERRDAFRTNLIIPVLESGTCPVNPEIPVFLTEESIG